MDAFGFDLRIRKGLAKQLITEPTPVQSAVIPVALQGKDLLVKARTGSGKTFAYLLPILQKILLKKTAFFGLILVPTKELAKQLATVVAECTCYCEQEVKIFNLAGMESFQMQKSLLADQPSLLVSTPSKILPHLECKSLVIKDSLEMFVIDEADLVVSFGYKDDLNRIMSFLPNFCQTILVSATLTPEIESLQQLLLKQPVSVRLDEPEEGEGKPEGSSKLQQFCIKCGMEEKEKFLILYVIFKLKLLKGKCIIFVNQVNASYKLRLFLEQFSIRSCILNPELPLNSRYHIVDEFNKGFYDIIVAADSAEVTTGDKEFSASRGLDFKSVDFVINFDVPASHHMYIHRVGRTARGIASGTAYTFWSEKKDLAGMQALKSQEAARGKEIADFSFDFSQIEAFRYRMEDAFRSVTKTAIREARLKEIKAELLNSARLKSHFAANPQDLEALRHDKAMHPAKIQAHLKHVPDYLMKSVLALSSDSLPAATPKQATKPRLHERTKRKPFDSKRGGKRKKTSLSSISINK